MSDQRLPVIKSGYTNKHSALFCQKLSEHHNAALYRLGDEKENKEGENAILGSFFSVIRNTSWRRYQSLYPAMVLEAALRDTNSGKLPEISVETYIYVLSKFHSEPEYIEKQLSFLAGHDIEAEKAVNLETGMPYCKYDSLIAAVITYDLLQTQCLCNNGELTITEDIITDFLPQGDDWTSLISQNNFLCNLIMDFAFKAPDIKTAFSIIPEVSKRVFGDDTFSCLERVSNDVILEEISRFGRNTIAYVQDELNWVFAEYRDYAEFLCKIVAPEGVPQDKAGNLIQTYLYDEDKYWSMLEKLLNQGEESVDSLLMVALDVPFSKTFANLPKQDYLSLGLILARILDAYKVIAEEEKNEDTTKLFEAKRCSIEFDSKEAEVENCRIPDVEELVEKTTLRPNEKLAVKDFCSSIADGLKGYLLGISIFEQDKSIPEEEQIVPLLILLNDSFEKAEDYAELRMMITENQGRTGAIHDAGIQLFPITLSKFWEECRKGENYARAVTLADTAYITESYRALQMLCSHAFKMKDQLKETLLSYSAGSDLVKGIVSDKELSVVLIYDDSAPSKMSKGRMRNALLDMAESSFNGIYTGGYNVSFIVILKSDFEAMKEQNHPELESFYTGTEYIIAPESID
jgi:hypothetical protein